MHKPATDYSDEAFFKEVWRLKDFIDSNQIEVLNIARPKPTRRACVRPERAPTVIGRSAKRPYSEQRLRALHNPRKEGAEDQSC